MKDDVKSDPFLNNLTLLFVALKLMHHIDWSWGWVLWPVWLQILIGVLLGVAATRNK